MDSWINDNCQFIIFWNFKISYSVYKKKIGYNSAKQLMVISYDPLIIHNFFIHTSISLYLVYIQNKIWFLKIYTTGNSEHNTYSENRIQGYIKTKNNKTS